MWYVHCEVDLEYELFFCSRVLCNGTRKVVQYFLHMNEEMKNDVILPCIYFKYSWLVIYERAANGIKWEPLLVLKDIFLEIMNKADL